MSQIGRLVAEKCAKSDLVETEKIYQLLTLSKNIGDHFVGHLDPTR